jgi:cytochrome c oxidase subunit IV
MTDHNEEAPASKGGYFVIFAAIAGLVFLAIGVSFMNLGHNAIYANLAIAGTQACLLAYFFMHLKGAEELTWIVVGGGLFWIFILFLFVLTDYVTRQIAAY